MNEKIIPRDDLRLVVGLELRDGRVIALDDAHKVVLPTPLLADLADLPLLIRLLQLLVLELQLEDLLIELGLDTLDATTRYKRLLNLIELVRILRIYVSI